MTTAASAALSAGVAMGFSHSWQRSVRDRTLRGTPPTLAPAHGMRPIGPDCVWIGMGESGPSLPADGRSLGRAHRAAGVRRSRHLSAADLATKANDRHAVLG